MTNLLLALYLGLSWSTGMLLTCLLLPGHWRSELPLKALLGACVGPGVSAGLYFVWCLFAAPGREGFLPVELIVLALLVVALIVRQRFLGRPASPLWPRLHRDRLTLLLSAVALFALLLALFNFSALYQVRPHGRYDAWAIWNLSARLIQRGGETWTHNFSPAFLHADYPLLLPLNVARLWQYLHSETQRAPMALAGLYTFTCAGLLVAGLRRARDLRQALLAGAVLLCTPLFMAWGTSQEADVPTACYLLATLVLFQRGAVSGFDPGSLALAGLLAGFAAWTKNEGLLFLAGAGGGLAFYLVWKHRSLPRPLLFFALGAALPLAEIIYFKQAIAPANDLINAHNLATLLQKIADPQRYLTILSYLVKFLVSFGGWPIPLLLILAGYLLLMRPYLPSGERPAIRLIAALLAFQLLGYLAIYLITPHPLDWHIPKSFDRLLLHLYPSFLFLFFLIARSPGQQNGDTV